MEKVRAVDYRDLPPLKQVGHCSGPQNGRILILYVEAAIKEIFSLGRRYPWPRPAQCPCCAGRKVWGHGYVLAFFDGFAEGLWLRRYRCPECRCVLRVRPEGYLNRFQASVASIRLSLTHRLNRGRWPPYLSRSRQRHWMRALRRKVEAYLGKRWSRGLLAAFDHLLSLGKNPVSRSI